MVELGNKVEDRVTGFTGIATSITTYLNGCVRVGVQRKVGSDGKIPDVEYFDIGQLTVLDTSYKQQQKNTGGPGDNPRYYPTPL